MIIVLFNQFPFASEQLRSVQRRQILKINLLKIIWSCREHPHFFVLLLLPHLWVLHELEVGDCAFEQLYIRIDFFRDRLQDDHVGDQGCELSIELHVVVPDDVEHVDEELDPLEVEYAGIVQYRKQFFQLHLVLVVSTLDDLLAIEIGESINQGCTFVTVALHHRLQEVGEVESVVLFQFDDHPHIDDVDPDLVSALPDHLSNSLLLSRTRFVQSFQGLAFHHFEHEVFRYEVVFLQQVGFDFTDKGNRLLCYLHQDIASVAVSMDKIVLHQHLEEGCGTQTRNHCVQRVPVVLEVSHRHSLHEGLDKYGVPGLVLESLWEFYALVALKMSVKDLEVVFLDVEIYLVDESLLEGVLAHRDLVGLGEKGQKFTNPEHDVDISLDVLVDLRVAHLHSHFVSLVDPPVHLAHRPRSDRDFFEGVKYLLNRFPEGYFEDFLSFFVAVLGSVFPEVPESICHFWSNDISSVTEVLEGLDPDHSCFLNC